MKGAEPFLIEKNSKIGVLMIHGFTSTPYQYREIGDYLSSKGITVYAPLIAGHGTSPDDLMKTGPEDWKNSVRKAYLELKKKSEKIVVLGNSFGGNLAFWLAGRGKEDIDGIISLGTPISLKYQWFLLLRIYSYGWLKKYYKKPKHIYKIDYTDMMDEITYPVIPLKSLRDFFRFIKKETPLDIKKIKVPIMVMQANIDPVTTSRSATYIYRNVLSNYKKIIWFESRCHAFTDTDESRRKDLFEKIYGFIKELENNNFI